MNTAFYADANAGLAISPRHLDRVCKLLNAADGNPSSVHAYGRRARVAVEKARQEICGYLGITSDQFVFTSGGTESNNLVIRAFLTGASSHLLISAGDHPSITATAEHLRDQGLCSFSVIPIDKHGLLQVDELQNLIQENTVLVCLTHANSETGIINDVEQVAQKIKEFNPATHVHCDAVQMLGKVDMQGHLASSGLDSVSFSAHKLGALKGCGGLYLRDKHALRYGQLSGGSQEQNRRGGTENLSGIISFGFLVASLPERLPLWQRHVSRLKSQLVTALLDIPGLVLHNDTNVCLPNTVNFHIEGVKGEDLILNLDLAGIAVSSGSACSSGIARPSHVLKAMGYSDQAASNSIRVSFAAQGDTRDIERMVAVIKRIFTQQKVSH